MVNSEFPLLKGNVLVVSELNSWKQLLVIETDPQRVLHIAHIHIVVDDTTSLPRIKLLWDGKEYLDDFLMLDATLAVDCGRALELYSNRKKPMEVFIKKTAAGVGDLTATCFVDGIETR